MLVSVSATGGCNHSAEVPADKQMAHAQKIADELKEVLTRNHCNVSGSVMVGSCSATFFTTSTTLLDEPDAAAPSA